MTESLLKTSYQERFRADLAAIEEFLETLLTPENPQPELLWQALRHGVLDGGKRIRPVLLIESCLACGGKVEQALATACALELIHCYSLIHDDLPCMDDDDMRRGKPTVHKAYSEAMAVLAGDALLPMAYGAMVDKTSHVPDKILLQVISALSKAAGTQGLVNGQVDDILFAQETPSEAILYRIHHGKTGALLTFSTWAGAVLSGQEGHVPKLMAQFGEGLGLLFQMTDDLLDATATGDVLGKTPGKDAVQGKITFPAVFGITGTQAVLKTKVIELNSLLDELEIHIQTDQLRFLLEFIVGRTF